jgi:hypothetical protein
MNKNKIFIILSLFGFGAIARLIPHAPNFAPVAAIAIASSLCLSKKWSVILPILAMLISDLFIGFYDWRLMAVVYISFGLIGIFSWFLKKHANIFNVVATSLMASIFFFLATNIAVWAFSAWYTKTFAGLMFCLEMGLPFLRNTMLGDLFYTAVLCGAILLAREINKKRAIINNRVIK